MATIQEQEEAKLRDTIRELIKDEFLNAVAQFATLQESTKPQPGTVNIFGKEYKYVFPNPRVVRECIKLGFPLFKFKEVWDSVETDDEKFKKFFENWPLFVHLIIDGDSKDIDNLDVVTYGEAQSIHLGFSNLAWEVRQNSKAG